MMRKVLFLPLSRCPALIADGGFLCAMCRMGDKIMAVLELPMWFATECSPARQGQTPCGEHGGSYAFSDGHQLVEFIAAQSTSSWDVVYAHDREGLLIVIADAHIRGNAYVCLTPESDGTGGERIFLTDLIQV